ncbi:hypothetical protein SEA_WEASELS2_23 [Rhodococcus phage Weasels2]|uniref:Uncharacterized protein n=1 Tax=Rhodococcus phage Weasels2 TaxID=1897437 RepID=A0A1I9SA07_9CAUD|nr:hypothetical protein FDH04_gp023 [Rhodococcus phage Weasels2]AOZ63613.1 hypothetical protein SEA_WEASELS2_23 [Rhodococcus phage Weasels2]
MPLYLGHADGNDKLAAKIPFYIPKACFIQNLYTDAAMAFMFPTYVVSVATLLFSLVAFSWLFIVSIPLVLLSIAHIIFRVFLSKRDSMYNDVGARRINVYLRLPAEVRKDLKPLAKHVYKNGLAEDERSVAFWRLMDEYSEKYPQPEPKADPLDELIEKHKQILKAWTNEL